MTRTRRFMRGLGVGYVSQIVLVMVGLWVTRFLLDRLGQNDYGLWLVGTQLLAYLMLTDLGIVALLPRDVAVATGQAPSGGIPLPDITGLTIRIVLLQLPLVAITGVLFWAFLPAEWEPLRRPLGILILAFLATFPLRVPPATLSGLQDLTFLGVLQTGALLAGTATTVGLVVAGVGLSALATGWAATQLVLGVGATWRLARCFPQAIPHRLPRLTLDVLRARLGRGAWLSASQIAMVLINATDTVIIGKLLGAAAVVPYACTGKLILFLANQPQLLIQIAQPGLAELRASESRSRVLHTATALTQAVLLVSGGIACGVMAVNYGFVHLWVGPAQWGGFTLTALILARTLGAQWNATTGSALFAFGYERRLAIVGVLDGLLFLGGTTLLVPRLGTAGAPIAGLATLALLSLPLNLSALARETGSSVANLAASLWPWAWRFGLAFALAAGIGRLTRPTSLAAIAIAGTAAVTVYALLVLGRVRTPPLSLYVHVGVTALLDRLPRPFGADR